MKIIHLGQGVRSPHWLRAVSRTRGAESTAIVVNDVSANSGSGSPPQYGRLDEALAAESADISVVTGVSATSWALESLAAGVSVIMDEPGVLSLDDYQQLESLVREKDCAVYLPVRDRYARCRKLMKRFLSSGRLGSIGHVSCLDNTHPDSQPAGESAGQLSRNAIAHFQSLRSILDATPTKVMARLSSDGGETEAYLEFDGHLRVHYTGASRTGIDSHELWIEGSEGSLRTDGRSVWWRKRGWHIFAPVKFSLLGRDAEIGSERRLLGAISGSSGSAASSALSEVATIAAAYASNESGAPVAIASVRS